MQFPPVKKCLDFLWFSVVVFFMYHRPRQLKQSKTQNLSQNGQTIWQCDLDNTLFALYQVIHLYKSHGHMVRMYTHKEYMSCAFKNSKIHMNRST